MHHGACRLGHPCARFIQTGTPGGRQLRGNLMACMGALRGAMLDLELAGVDVNPKQYTDTTKSRTLPTRCGIAE